MISPRYPASIVPGEFRTVTPCFRARPERGCTRPTKPEGKAIETPVGTSSRLPGAIESFLVERRSAPASPAFA